MALELLAEIEVAPGKPELPDDWRGLIDFGETWTKADQALSPFGRVPVGEPLMYGCGLSGAAAGGKVRITLIVLDMARPVMTRGASFTLRDGKTVRASGRLM